jgi:hypothetical protein
MESDADAEAKADQEHARQADAAGAALWLAVDPHDQLLLNAGWRCYSHKTLREVDQVHGYALIGHLLKRQCVPFCRCTSCSPPSAVWPSGRPDGPRPPPSKPSCLTMLCGSARPRRSNSCSSRVLATIRENSLATHHAQQLRAMHVRAAPVMCSRVALLSDSCVFLLCV